MIGSSKTTFGFDPRTIPGCQLWLDAADQSSMTLSGSTVTQWSDKSGNGFNANAYTGVAAPVYSQSARTITFNGTNYFYTNYPSNPTNESVFIIFNSASVSAGNLIEGNKPSGGGARQIAFTTSGGNFNANSSGITAGPSITGYLTGVTYIGECFITSGSTQLYINGQNPSSSVSLSFTAGNTTNIGAFTTSQNGTPNYLYSGTISEILIYNTALGTTQRQQVEGYLANKWGLTGYYAPKTPLSIPGCQLWLDAADSSTITLSSSKVTQWNDKSGNGYNFTQATSGNQPTYSTASLNTSNTITFTSANSTFLTGTASTTFMGTNSLSVYGVFKTNNNTSSSSVFAKSLAGGAGGRILYAVRDGGNPGYINSGIGTTGQNAYANTLSDTYTVGAWRVHGFVSDRSGWTTTLFQNGSLIATTTITADTTTNLTNPYQMIIGGYNTSSGSVSPPLAGYYLDGAIAEILVFSTVLTTTQRQTIETYLAKKWGFTSMYPAIPSTHPFYSVRPYLRAFQPTDISGCQLWLDGADQSSVTLSGTTVTQWNDKSGNGRNTSSAIGTSVYVSNAVNKLPGVYFNSTAFRGPFVYSGTQLHCFLVGTMGDSGSFTRILSIGNGTQEDFNSPLTTILFCRGGSGVSSVRVVRNDTGVSASFSAYNTPFLAVSAQYSNTQEISVNGATPTTGTTNTSASFSTTTYGLGIQSKSGGTGEQALVGYICELIVFNTYLTVSQRQQVEGYLAHKWGLNLTYGTNTPLTIPGCQLWLDGADSSTITGTTSVTAWADKSGMNYTMTNNQGTCSVSAASLNGLNTIYVPSGANLKLANFLFHTKFTTFIVGKADTGKLLIGGRFGTNNIVFYEYTGNDGLLAVPLPSGTTYLDVYDTVGLATRVVSNNTWFIWSIGYDNLTNNTANPHRINGIARTTSAGSGSSIISSSSGTGSLYLNSVNGTGSYDSDYFAEIIHYNTTLTTTQCQTIEGYLARKWGLTISNQFLLTHPFNRIPPASVVFSPLSISGVSLWLDAADINGNGSAFSVGGTISTWVDKSPLGNNMTGTSVTYTYDSTYRANAPTFNGSSSLFNQSNSGIYSLNNATTWTIFTVNRRTDTSWYNAVYNAKSPGSGQNNYLIYRYSPSAGGFQFYLGDTTGSYIGSGSGTGDGITTLTARTSGTAEGFINGSSIGTGSTSSSSGQATFTIGLQTGAYMNGFIFEVIVYNIGLSTPERQRVEGYLAQKWGLTGSLPSTHPFKKIPA
jgi:hypothetical protein